MAESIGDAFVDLGVKDKQYTRKMNRAQKSLSGFGKTLVKVGALLATTFAVRGLGRAGLSLINLGSDAAETANKFNVVFSSMNEEANNISANLVKNFGLARSESQKFLGDTGDLLAGFGFAEDKALDLSKQVAELGVDLASFTNIEGGAAEAVKSLTRLLVGETEPAKKLGIVVRQDSAEFKNLVKTMMESEGATLLQAKAQAALTIATKQSKLAAGDFARTADGQANIARVLSSRWRDFKEALGASLSELFSVRDLMKGLIGVLARWTEKIREMNKQGAFIIMGERIKAFAKIAVIALKPVIKLAQVLVKTFAAVAKALGAVVGEVVTGLGFEGIDKVIREMEQNIKRRLGELNAAPTGGKTGAATSTTGAAGAQRTRQAPSFVGFAQAIKSFQSTLVEKKEAKKIKLAEKRTKSLEKIEKSQDDISAGLFELSRKLSPAVVSS